ncbi:MAG: ABC transporter permease [Firmicutes bacterium]|nr:ABC transporter permease [Bacillota bacterium]
MNVSPAATRIRGAVVPSNNRNSMVRLLWANRRARWGLLILAFMVLVALFAPILSPYNPTATIFAPSLAPSWQHLLGTTLQGQDIFSQLISGTRNSLGVGFAVGIIATGLSLLIGVLPTMGSTWINAIFSTFTNVVLILPGLPLLIVISAYLHSSGALTIALIIGFTGWAWGSRVLRSQAMTLRQRDFVVAARLAGASNFRLLRREILPNMASLVLSHFMFAILFGILAEAGLQFLGLGNVVAVSWGSMLYWAQSGSAMALGMWWWFIPPGFAIAIVGVALSMVNSGMDQVSNPRLRTASKKGKVSQ